MDVFLYNTSDPPNKVNKSLSNKKELNNVRFKDEGKLDVLNPKILVKLTSEISDYIQYNYCYVPKFTRYYFIESIIAYGGLVEISCKSDPLKSFSKDILGSTQYVSRSENIINRYLVDSLMPISSKHLYTIKPFGDKVYDENCINVILETAGKGGV